MKFQRCLPALFLALFLAWPSRAQAQYANNGIGFDFGYSSYSTQLGLQNGLDYGMHTYGIFAEDWQWTIRILLAFLSARNPHDTQTQMLFHPDVTVRYNFATDQFRPYAQGGAAFFLLATGDSTEGKNYIPCLTAGVGLEDYVGHNFSLGLGLNFVRLLIFSGPDYNSTNAGINATFSY